MRVPLVVPLLAVALAVAAAGCGVGPATNQEKISKTASTYLKALADSDTATACAQLTPRARGEACDQALKERLRRLDSGVLKGAADDSMDIDVDGKRATARLSKPEGAQFVLVQTGGEWRIDSGYTLD
jgi:hypothetical protein